MTRSKGIVEKLEKLGLSVSYNRVIQVERMLAHNVCEQFKSDGVVCPPALKHGLYTVGAIDNIDHNPTSTSANGSLHGTAISVMQFPTHEGPGDTRQILFQTENIANEPTLPDSYTVVQAVSMKPSSTSVPPLQTAEYTGYLEPAIAEEKECVRKASSLLGQNISAEQTISWAGYHASLQSQLLNPPAKIALLPLFLEKADSPAILKMLTTFLNPGQIPVIACDCPIFAQCKYIQWKWPLSHEEDKMIVMMGGLHTEKALWNSMGDMLASSIHIHWF